MTAIRGTRDDPAIQKEIAVHRFLWPLMAEWHKLKGKKVELAKFYQEQQGKLEEFDRKHPGHFPPPEFPLPLSKQPFFPDPGFPAILATHSKPRSTLPTSPPPSPKQKATPAPVPSDLRAPPPKRKTTPAPVPGDLGTDRDAEGSEDETVPAKPLKPAPA